MTGCAVMNPSVDSSTSQFGLCSIANGMVWTTESKRAAVEEMRRRGTLEACATSIQAGYATLATQQPIMPTYKPVPPATLTAPAPAPVQITMQAFFTGRMETAQSVTGAYGFNCEYSVNGQKFWRMYVGSCPANVEVR
jgi:hypothetical protein